MGIHRAGHVRFSICLEGNGMRRNSRPLAKSRRQSGRQPDTAYPELPLSRPCYRSIALIVRRYAPNPSHSSGPSACRAHQRLSPPQVAARRILLSMCREFGNVTLTNQLRCTSRTLGELARLERFELPTFWFVARHSIQLSYRRTALETGGERGIRTLEELSPLRP